jgi:exosortase/archaeosortase family protein
LTAALPIGARRAGPLHAGLAAAGLAVAVLLVAAQAQIRRGEALGSAALLSLLRIAPARSFGTAVTFPAQGRYVGFTVAAGCTAALLIVPFVLVAVVLLLAGRVRPGRAVATVAVFAVVVTLINQLRLLVIAEAMRAWGYPKGFDRSHVLLGTIVSTIGVAGGLLLFLRMVVPRSQADRRG